MEIRMLTEIEKRNLHLSCRKHPVIWMYSLDIDKKQEKSIDGTYTKCYEELWMSHGTIRVQTWSCKGIGQSQGRQTTTLWARLQTPWGFDSRRSSSVSTGTWKQEHWKTTASLHWYAQTRHWTRSFGNPEPDGGQKIMERICWCPAKPADISQVSQII